MNDKKNPLGLSDAEVAAVEEAVKEVVASVALAARSVTWVDVCRSLYMVGLMENFTESECDRVAQLLKARIDDGTVVYVDRGLFAVADESVLKEKHTVQ